MEHLPAHNIEEEPKMAEFEVAKIADGLGFGEGGISHAERAKLIDNPELISLVETALMSDEILIPVDTDTEGAKLDDDGCGDGRGVSRVFEGMVLKARSLNRSKVFGGGAAMAAASLIGLGKANGMQLDEVFGHGIATLKNRMIGFGAHTDTHAHGPNCGCGAIDKAPEAIYNSVKYENQIRAVISGLEVDCGGLDEVYEEFKLYAETMDGNLYKGKDIATQIMEDGKIVKELDDDHREMYIVLNLAPGYTVNQCKIRELSGQLIQIFGVDVWRMQDIANRAFDDSEDQRKAFLSELVYTLGVAATLTKGDLPVYLVTASPSLVTAQTANIN